MQIKPKKSLGQNFLVDKNIQKKIISNCGFSSQDVILEIGPGRGELTWLIAEVVKKIYAVEIDSRLCLLLKDNLREYQDKVEIINQDILKFDLNMLFKKIKQKIIILGDIPYYISTPIIEYIIKHRRIISRALLTVQKDFAKRIIAPSGTREAGCLTYFVQYYTKPKALFTIKKTSFSPSPKIDSCFLELEIRRQPVVRVEDEEVFFKIIRASFNKRRKMLRNSLKGVIAQEKLDTFFKRYKINSNIRPERLTLADFANLT